MIWVVYFARLTVGKKKIKKRKKEGSKLYRNYIYIKLNNGLVYFLFLYYINKRCSLF